MILLVMQFSPTSRHFFSLRSRYSPEHSVHMYVCVFICTLLAPSTQTEQRR
jgi:hypothetical protein